MSNIFANVQKYAGKWEVVGQPTKLDNEDLAAFQPIATIVKSTWGKSIRFTTKVGGYQQFIPCDTQVDLPIGTSVDITKILISILHKDGEKDIYRASIEETPRF